MIPIIGALTPVGLMVVNIAAFIVHHLDAFRLIITVLAFVSGLMLNSWTGLNIYRNLRRRAPGHAVVADRNQEFAIVGGMAVVIIAAALTAWFCYQGLSNEKNLPNALTFLTGAVAVAIPVGLKLLFGNRDEEEAGA